MQNVRYNKDYKTLKGSNPAMKKKTGFTLVEILIVVVILGILAAIVVPMFSDASIQSRNSAISNDLQKVRGLIELYKFHHNDELPAFTGETSNDFIRRMTTKTDIYGDAGTNYGPYLNKVPKNPFSGKNSVRIDGAAAGANTDGWRFDTANGIFQSDDSPANASL